MTGVTGRRSAILSKLAAVFMGKKRLPPGFCHVTQTAGGVSVTYVAPIKGSSSEDQSATGEFRSGVGPGNQSGTGRRLPLHAWGHNDFRPVSHLRKEARETPPQGKAPEQPQQPVCYSGCCGTDACCARKGSIKEKAFWLSMVLLTLAMVAGAVRVWQFVGRTADFQQVV